MGDQSPEYLVRLTTVIRTDLGPLVAARIAWESFDSGEVEFTVEWDGDFRFLKLSEVEAVDTYGNPVKEVDQ